LQVRAIQPARIRSSDPSQVLRQIERTYRDAVDEHGEPVELRLAMDDYATHKHKNCIEGTGLRLGVKCGSRRPAAEEPGINSSKKSNSETGRTLSAFLCSSGRRNCLRLGEPWCDTAGGI
jgi:hypothetical protein